MRTNAVFFSVEGYLINILFFKTEKWTYSPKARSFSTPKKRYLSRRYFFPLDITCRNIPPPSPNFKGVSDVAMFSQSRFVRFIIEYTPNILNLVKYHWMLLELWTSVDAHGCQPAFKTDPLYASKFDPPVALVWGAKEKPSNPKSR